jgi:hypothetical protein
MPPVQLWVLYSNKIFKKYLIWHGCKRNFSGPGETEGSASQHPLDSTEHIWGPSSCPIPHFRDGLSKAQKEAGLAQWYTVGPKSSLLTLGVPVPVGKKSYSIACLRHQRGVDTLRPSKCLSNFWYATHSMVQLRASRNVTKGPLTARLCVFTVISRSPSFLCRKWVPNLYILKLFLKTQ